MIPRQPARVLTVRQPFAWLIVNSFKPVENRGWSTHYRGPLLIHAGVRPSQEEWLRLLAEVTRIDPLIAPRIPLLGEIECGGIVGRVQLTGCVLQHESRYFTGPWGWVLRDAQPLPFQPRRGRQGLWTLPEESEVRP